VNAVLPALIGVAVGLVVGALLFLLIAARSGGSLSNRTVLVAKLAPLVLVLVLLLVLVVTR
jgi:gas vesicle protein